MAFNQGGVWPGKRYSTKKESGQRPGKDASLHYWKRLVRTNKLLSYWLIFARLTLSYSPSSQRKFRYFLHARVNLRKEFIWNGNGLILLTLHWESFLHNNYYGKILNRGSSNQASVRINKPFPIIWCSTFVPPLRAARRPYSVGNFQQMAKLIGFDSLWRSEIICCFCLAAIFV